MFRNIILTIKERCFVFRIMFTIKKKNKSKIVSNTRYYHNITHLTKVKTSGR